jgi:glycosyltransferase involved in cell wall biosynthesis
MNVVHLTASTFFGGPERQMLGLARALTGACRTAFLSFAEGGRCQAFLDETVRQGFAARALENDTPHLGRALSELTETLRHLHTTVLCCHGYKANLLGRIAARRIGVPAVAVSRGWTGESWKVRIYERLDRWNLRWMDRVVCVSDAQAIKVRQAGAPPERIVVIPNAVQPERFKRPDPARRQTLERMFPQPPRRIIGAAGRLSPEKGFGVLVEAAAQALQVDPALGFVHFGDGPLRAAIAGRITKLGIADRFILAGFRRDLDAFMPCLDLLVLPSFTEGMPNVVLEAFAAAVPIVATAVGGTPEVIEDGVNGFLVPPGDAGVLARRIGEALISEETRQAMGRGGQQSVLEKFTFDVQGRRYLQLLEEVLHSRACLGSVPEPQLLGSSESERSLSVAALTDMAG